MRSLNTLTKKYMKLSKTLNVLQSIAQAEPDNTEAHDAVVALDAYLTTLGQAIARETLRTASEDVTEDAQETT